LGPTKQKPTKTKQDYLFFLKKYELLKDYCDTPPAYSEYTDKRTGKTYNCWYFNTLNYEVFALLAKVFYTWDPQANTWVKCVPADIAVGLTLAAMAHMFMDHGSRKNPSRAMRISTQFLREPYYKRLKEAMLFKHWINVSDHGRMAEGDPNRFVYFIRVCPQLL
jgi:hypothetical protein